MDTNKTDVLWQVTEVLSKQIEWAIQAQQTPMTRETAKSVYVVLHSLKQMADLYDTTLPMGNASAEARLNAIIKIVPALYFDFIAKYQPKP